MLLVWIYRRLRLQLRKSEDVQHFLMFAVVHTLQSRLLQQTVSSGTEFPGTVRFENGDFFGLKVKEEDKYDVVYDYTYASFLSHGIPD
jgi:hypothetical protein